MVLKQTQISQRSLNYSWVRSGQQVDIPADVIIDIGITTPTICDVAISYVHIHDGELICTLVYILPNEKSTPRLMATVRTSVTGSPVSLDCAPGFSGSILLGDLNKDFEKLYSEPLVISPMCVVTVPERAYTSRLKVVKGAEEFILSGRFSINCDSNIKLSISNSDMCIALSDTAKAGLLAQSDGSASGVYYLRSLNNVHGEHINIDINLTINPIQGAVNTFSVYSNNPDFRSTNLISAMLKSTKYDGVTDVRPFKALLIDADTDSPIFINLPQPDENVLSTYEKVADEVSDADK